MQTFDLLSKNSSLSRLVDMIEKGGEAEIIIARNGRPAAKLVPLTAAPKSKVRLGLAKGLFEAPDDIDASNDEIEQLFYGGAV